MSRERAKLEFGDSIATNVPAPVSAEDIKQVTRSAGLRETPRHHDKTASAPIQRRARRKTGRIHQFATRLREETIRQIHEYADRHEITLAEAIEHAFDALGEKARTSSSA